MAFKITGNALLQLRTLFNEGAIGALSDGQLLEQFATSRGESRELAFAELVERHGPLVLRVCRSILRDEGAADDAFQATFLALARKAGALWAHDSLAPWLHQAAYRAAAHDRSATIRRRLHEHAAAALRPESMAPPHHAVDYDLEKIIHEEIDRLPSRFRVAVVLVDIEGRTHEQAARHLRCAVGTVKSRLARGRKRLRGQLVRRGVAPAAALAAASVGEAARAAVPTGLAKSTIAYAATAGTVPASVAVITEGALKTMFLSKVKLVMAAAAVAASTVALAQSGIGKTKDGAGKPIESVGPSSQNQNAAYALGANSSRSENVQERRKIVVTSPKATDVAIAHQYACQIHAHRHIDVCALGDGYLNEIKVREGQAVKQGELMLKIVPAVNGAQRAARSANVRAPFDGIVGRFHEQQGSFIKDGGIVTTLTDNSVMWVYFRVPDKLYLEYMANRKEFDDNIELVMANHKKFPRSAQSLTVEGEFNKKNGNIAFRADFLNPDGLLRHGQTGAVLMHRTLHNAIAIPQLATFEIGDKRYVSVVDKDNVVHRRQIFIQHERHDYFFITKGVAVGDKIAIEGARQVADGEKVEYEFRPLEEVMRTQKNHSE